MSLKRRWLLFLVFTIAVLACTFLFADPSWARVGGGQGYGRGGGGRSSGGSGGGGDSDLIWLLIWLCIEYPAVGIPLVMIVMTAFGLRFLYTQVTGRTVHRTTVHQTQQRRPRRARPVLGLAKLRNDDDGFSMPPLLDFLVLLHRRSLAAVGTGAWGPLAPFLTEKAVESIQAGHQEVRAVHDVTVGGIKLLKVEPRGSFDHLYVEIESTRTETVKGNKQRHVLVTERWTLRRNRDATSPEPAKLERLGCPNCGASIELTKMGECRNCDTPITAGQLSWQAFFVRVISRKVAKAPEVGWVAGGDEESLDWAPVIDPDLAASMRKLKARHPTFAIADFGGRVSLTYLQLQEAWGSNKWELARPFTTDRMFQTLRFWMDRYKREGLTNKLDDVKLEAVDLVKIDVDAWYESLTVRIVGSMKDYVVNKEGEVIGGNAKTARRFAEYWTFLRAAGTDGSTHGDKPVCPSCGAPLDQVSAAGICGYCDSKITGGDHDWVLTRIDQPEAYEG